jgi:arylsulfatase A-like enzyme
MAPEELDCGAMTNLVLIMSDQQRADSLGCSGNRCARTPNLDALADRGASMLNHFTPNQICSPSRATLFSGRYARHHGLTRNGIALPPDLALISNDLSRAGYQTYGVGKFHFQPILAPAEYAMPDSDAFWSLPESESWHGPFYGFDRVGIVIGESAASTRGGHYAQWLNNTAPEAANLYLPEHALSPRATDLDEVWKCAVPEGLHYNAWIADQACDFIDRMNGGDPFFLFVSFPDPHHPFSPPAPWCDLFDPDTVPLPSYVPGELDLMPGYIRDNRSAGRQSEEDGKGYLEYLLDPGLPREQGFIEATHRFSVDTIRQAIAHTYGMVSMIDRCVGRIIAALTSKGLIDDTVILFTSDHGELLGDHGLIRKGPAPYRQLLQVPMVVSGPGIVPGARCQMTSHLDIKATILELLGLSGDRGDGMSFADVLRRVDAPGRTRLFAEYHPRAFPDQYNQTILNSEWRLTIYPRRPDWGELFDWRTDPNEHRNLFFDSAYASIRKQLSRTIERDWPPASEAGLEAIAVY